MTMGQDQNNGEHASSISFFCPTYKDEENIVEVARKASTLLPRFTDTFEVLIVEDGSPDNTSQVVDTLSQELPAVRVIHHPRNLGYGAALQSGFINSRNYTYICYTDGDNQYDVNDIGEMIPYLPEYDMVVSYRINKSYGHYRMFMSQVYNWLVRVLFNIPDMDVGSPTKIMKKSVALCVKPDSISPFANAEMIIRARECQLKIKRIPIRSYPRVFGKSSVASFKNILRTIRDMSIFKYQLLIGKPRWKLDVDPEKRHP